MSGLLDQYGEQWRAAQPPPAAVAVSQLRDRKRWPLVAAVAVLAAAALTGLAVHDGSGSTLRKPAQLTTYPTTAAPTTAPKPQPSATAARPSPEATQPCTPADLAIGRPVTSGKTTSVRLTARTACTLTGPSLVAAPPLRTGTPPIALAVGAVAEVDVIDSTGGGCERLNEPTFSETVTLGDAVLMSIRLPRTACGDYLYSKLVTRPAATPPPAAECEAANLYGSVDGQATASGFTYELALTNTGSTSCQLTGRPLSVRGVKPDGSVVDIVPPTYSGPFQSAHLTGPASPGEPEHVLVYGPNGCTTGTGLTLTELRLRLATGVVDVPATGALDGLLHLGCSPRLSSFSGPVSTLNDAVPPALPHGTPCTASDLRVTAVTYDHTFAGEDGYNVSVAPVSRSCVLRAADVAVPGVVPERGPDVPTGVVAGIGRPAYIFIGGSTGGLCPSTRTVTALGLSLGGTPVAVPPPVGQRTFTVCATDTDVHVAEAATRISQGDN